MKKIHLTLDATESAVLAAAARIFATEAPYPSSKTEEQRIHHAVEIAVKMAELVETRVRTGKELG